jgi:aerobic carbon-monoxide dehydrogenase large subunit
MTEPTGALGTPLRRLEDPRLITGQGLYVDDIRMDGMAHVAFVRSSEAHAFITSIDSSEATAMPGVIGVFTAADLGLTRPMTDPHPSPLVGDTIQAAPLSSHEVSYAGEPIAVVVAETRYQAADAAEMVWVDYDPLPAVVSIERAVAPDAPMVHSTSTSNVLVSLKARYGDIDAAFDEADHVIPFKLRQHRGACASMEPRGVVAHHSDEGTTMWTSSQGPFAVRKMVTAYFERDNIRVISPDVGGGFGPKGGIYPEEYVLPALAMRLGRPVKWIESRREHMLATNQQRDMVSDLEVAASADGRMLGLRGRILHDNGAYVPYGILLHMTGFQLIQGPYTLGAMDLTLDVVATNAVATSPIRGAARPNAAFIAERMADAVARVTGLDPFEVRRRNFIPADAFPYEFPLAARYGGNITYDSGDYHTAMSEVMRIADADGFADRRARAEAEGRLLGMGVAAYVEDTGLGPFEAVRMEVGGNGSVVVTTGTGSQGQGHATVLSQIVASQLGVDPRFVTVRSADTNLPGNGGTTVASRTAVTAMSSAQLAAVDVADQLRRLAADRMEAAEADLVFEGGMVKVAGQPGAEVSIAELAASAAEPVTSDQAFPTPRPPYAFGCHIAEVEVDPETGLVTVLNYSVAHDCGTVLNPMIVDGQIDGGVAHGLSNALYEQVSFAEDGQPLTTTFMDFRIPTAMEMPPLNKVHTVTPSPDNPLGAKGAGEGGTIPAAAAVVAAVENALSSLGVVVDRYPLFPSTVRRMVEEASR